MSTADSSRASICLYVCTYRRNPQLTRLLETVRVAAAAAEGRADVGVVIVDDNVDGRARAVADAFADSFALGTHYRHTGSGNISTARNAGLEAAAPLADWVAMTDDDCEVDPEWLNAYLELLERTGADAACGPHVRTAPADAPSWLRDHPFLQGDGEADFPADGSTPEHGQTNNSIIRSAFLLAHPELRFDLALGKLGGEDMVFFHQARELGLQLRFARGAVVREEADGNRLTRSYYVRAAYWFGNTQYVTSARIERVGRARVLLRAGKRMALGIAHPVRQLVRKQPAEVMFSVSRVAEALGLMVGAFGVEVKHPT